jgi:hypothetical protein
MLEALLNLAIAASTVTSPQIAQYQTQYRQASPTSGFGSIQTPDGPVNFSRRVLGNTVYENYVGPNGVVNCTTRQIGNQFYRDCY